MLLYSYYRTKVKVFFANTWHSAYPASCGRDSIQTVWGRFLQSLIVSVMLPGIFATLILAITWIFCKLLAVKPDPWSLWGWSFIGVPSGLVMSVLNRIWSSAIVRSAQWDIDWGHTVPLSIHTVWSLYEVICGFEFIYYFDDLYILHISIIVVFEAAIYTGSVSSIGSEAIIYDHIRIPLWLICIVDTLKWL